ncbi:LytTR family DNA-binding domain-containing protein [Chitinophaga sp. Cy-1792]|uniref:LytR/AlgR family response regulator transcription factor n=1 Tax=Chitinophaga sp. Cy-1792 TaxID=2608339 RepID=UPI0014247042|nr:LytTR family DNA-binding domain-containing protein [Chitinophaga sp. Cy-1792]NIG57662.1 response regulator transcription factor [Chitinophaga sp. Cy-1792]
MEIKFIAIDNEPPALDVITTHARQFKALKLVQTFDDAIAAAAWLRHAKVDLIFMDIQMPDISGVELARSLHDAPMIIFTTAYKQYAFDGFELNAVDYLLKPISFERFEKSIDKVLSQCGKQQEQSEKDFLVIHSSYQVMRIDTRRIRYIESLKDYVRIHLTDAAPVLTLMTMKKMLEQLPAGKFSRIHRSYIVAVHEIRSVSNRLVRMNCGMQLPVGDSYSQFLKEWKQP